MAHDVAETILIPRLSRGRQPAPVQLSRLLHAHEIILLGARTMARQAAEAGDDGNGTASSCREVSRARRFARAQEALLSATKRVAEEELVDEVQHLLLECGRCTRSLYRLR